jgi:Lipopolysaccharide-assembly
MFIKLFLKSTLRNLARKSFIVVGFVLFIFVALINFTSCGVYSFTGASVQEHIKTISIPIADDRSGAGEPNLRETLTQSLIQKFIDDNTLRVTDRSNANAVLECTITGFSDAPSVVSAGENVTLRRVTISVLVTYRDLVLKKNIFEKTFSNYGDYDPLHPLAERTSAISTAVDKLTGDILLDTVSGW